MASTINASVAGLGSVITTADNSGVIQLQANGTAGVTVNTSGAIGVGTSPSYGTSGQALISSGSGAAPTWGTAGITTGKSIAMAMIFGF